MCASEIERDESEHVLGMIEVFIVYIVRILRTVHEKGFSKKYFRLNLK